ncbi:MAG: type II toxin-antitoxin system VapC family toxin [Candidatus Woesearchaeota archaeon]
MIYIDSNVFATAALDQGALGQKARRIIDAIETGKLLACTSALTVGEVMWAVKKIGGKEQAIATARTILALRNLDVCDASHSVISEAVDIFSHSELHPRDAIHYATMRSRGIKTMISNDANFDKIKEITRKPIEKALI